jgi:hypothetical protein
MIMESARPIWQGHPLANIIKPLGPIMADLSTYRNKYLTTTILSGYRHDPDTQAILSKLAISPHFTVAVNLGSIA